MRKRACNRILSLCFAIDSRVNLAVSDSPKFGTTLKPKRSSQLSTAGNFSAALSLSTKHVRSAKAEAVVVAAGVAMAEGTEAAVAGAEVTAEAVVAAAGEDAAAVVTAATGNLLQFSHLESFRKARAANPQPRQAKSASAHIHNARQFSFEVSSDRSLLLFVPVGNKRHRLRRFHSSANIAEPLERRPANAHRNQRRNVELRLGLVQLLGPRR